MSPGGTMPPNAMKNGKEWHQQCVGILNRKCQASQQFADLVGDKQWTIPNHRGEILKKQAS